MALVQLSVEEYIQNFGINDNELQNLIASNSPTNESVDEFDALFSDSPSTPDVPTNFTSKITRTFHNVT